VDIATKPIHRFQRCKKDRQSPQRPLKNYRDQQLELFYQEKALNPKIEHEIRDGFFEIN
jgi:hypothetical protein